MTAFDGLRNHDLLLATGALTEMPRRRKPGGPVCPYDRQPCRHPRCALCARSRTWRAAWSMWGPLLPLALALGLIIGTAWAMIEGWQP